MNNRDQDNLKALFERFLPPAEAAEAAEEVRAGDEILEAHPAPQPREEVLVGIKLRIGERLSHRHKRSHLLRRFIGVAAAVIVVALAGLFLQAPPPRTGVAHAALIPAAIWESDDLSTDDMDIAYYTSEIRQIESQMRALEAGDSDAMAVASLNDMEMELMRINSEFWKE